MWRKMGMGIGGLFVLCILFLGADRWIHHRYQHDLLFSITTDYADPKWDLQESSMEPFFKIESLLNQPFAYLGKGSQSTVYLSADGRCVLKFLKQNKLRPMTWLACLPFSFNRFYQQALLIENKRDRTFSAIKLAVNQFQSETGILYAHLNKTDTLNKKVSIVDRKGCMHEVDLDQTSFMIQKKASLIYPRITELMEQGRLEDSKKVISSVFQLLAHLGVQGVVDNDPILRKNFGLVNDQAIQIDIGRMRIDPLRVNTQQYQEEIGSITHSFKVWIELHYPELLEHFIRPFA